MQGGALQENFCKNKFLGNTGETLAVGHLKDLGFEIVEQNYRCKCGEIDIIAKRKNELHFIEVKTRTNTNLSTPFDAITETKKNHIRKSSRMYLYKIRGELPACYYSVIGVDYVGGTPRIECIFDAFI